MGVHCCAGEEAVRDRAYGRVLLAALAINAGMFVVEIGAGLAAGSVALQADALDFLGDAGNYAISLAVLGSAPVLRARAALLKGLTMGGFGLWVILATGWSMANDVVPAAPVMGIVGMLALLANLSVLALLYAWRQGDANMRSVWICSRNDVLGNLAVLAAAAGVFGTGTGWPDLAVAAVMAALALSGAWRIVGEARRELVAPLAAR
ncbi:MAG: cation transporter [Alphaproteobacteria bacterium]|nr:cation transporter [Alphaproteobacteria bacterium]